jgi:hypothetical protein
MAVQTAVGTTTVDYQLHVNPPNGQAFVDTATVSWTGHPAHNIKTMLSLAGVPRQFNSGFQWDLRGVPGLTTWLSHPGHAISLTLRLIREEVSMGYSLSNLCVVRTVDGATDVLQTFTHELGHGLKQAVKEEPRWNAAGTSIAKETNPKWHRDNFGGQGPHCSTNAVLRSTPPLPPGLTSIFTYGGSGLLCTMFFSGEPHVDPDGKFCPACKPRLRRTTLNTSAMHSRWNDIG